MKKHLLFVLLLIGVPMNSTFGQCVDCPQCGHEVAVGFLQKSKEKKTVYSVSSKEIAVPEVCLPRPLFNCKAQLKELFSKKCSPDQPCGHCEPQHCAKHVRSGKLKVVNVLSERNVKCARCEYQWEVSDTEKVNEYLYEFNQQDFSQEGINQRLYAPVETKDELQIDPASKVDPSDIIDPNATDPKELLPGKNTLPLEDAPVIESPPVIEAPPKVEPIVAPEVKPVKELVKKEVLQTAFTESAAEKPPAQPAFEY